MAESSRAGFLYDVLDYDGPVVDETWAVGGDPARHALAFRRMWHGLLGVYPPASAHARFCAGKIPAAPAPNPSAFMAFVVNALKIPLGNSQPPDVSEYVRTLADAQVLRKEIEAKLCDRYSAEEAQAAGAQDKPLRSLHALLRANADFNEVRLDRNEATGSYVGPAPPVPERAERCAREKWRDVMSRDILFASRQITGSCVYAAAGSAPHARTVADEAAALSRGGPITLMSDCERTLKELTESADYYHHACLVPCREAYLAMPRLFQSFVLVGGARVPPLCKARERCWHYLPDSVPLDPAEESAYSVVCGSLASFLGTQDRLRRLCYFVPRLLNPGDGKPGRVSGFHPDTAGRIATMRGAEAVDPGLAFDCQVYGSCGAAGQGIAECMSCGGVVVAAETNTLVDDGINGFLARGGDVDGAVKRALGCDKRSVAREARRVSLLHGEETHRWLWRGILAGPDPVVSASPRDAAVLHHRFMVLSAYMRWREITRARAASVDRKSVMFMDNRPDPGGALAVLLTMANLKPGWGLLAFVTRESEPYYRRAFEHLGGDVEFVSMPDYKTRGFTIEQYNAKLKSRELWERVSESADRVLCVQNDGLLVRRGLESHPAMSKDYAGAPWMPHPYLAQATGGNLVGNGGFSLRSVPACLRACKQHAREADAVYPLAPIMSEAEDVWFARRIADCCPREDAQTFSMEQVYSPGALGYHRFWAYHGVDVTVSYLERLLLDTAVRVPSVSMTSEQEAAVSLQGRVPARPARIL
jgi:hypothetical protein